MKRVVKMRFKLDIQFFGGRGSSSGTGGASGMNVVESTSLISAREENPEEVDATLKVLKDLREQYGIVVNDVQLVTLKGKDKMTLAYYDSNGNLAVNEAYFNAAKMNKAMDACEKSGYHPSRGNKSGLEAVVAHEMGHALNHALAGGDWNKLDKVANDIVKKAARSAGYKSMYEFASKISGYAKKSSAEAIAEAFSDVYCNGTNAKRESRALVNELKGRFGGK